MSARTNSIILVVAVLLCFPQTCSSSGTGESQQSISSEGKSERNEEQPVPREVSVGQETPMARWFPAGQQPLLSPWPSGFLTTCLERNSQAWLLIGFGCSLRMVHGKEEMTHTKLESFPSVSVCTGS